MPGRKADDVETVIASPDQPMNRANVGRVGMLMLILLAVLGRAVFIALPVNSDTAMFVYAGKLVHDGGRPGVDLLDNKLPSVGLLMSVPYRWFGARWPAYGILGLALSLTATVFLFRGARDAWGRAPAVAVGVASAVWLNFPPAVYGQLQLETIQIALASIAGACVLRLLRSGDWRDALTAGMCGGMAIWAKPTGGAVLAAAVLALCFANLQRRTRISAVFGVTVGALIPVAIGAWAILASGMADALPETLRQLRDYSSQSTSNAMDIAKPVMVLGLLGFPVLILGWVFRRERTEGGTSGPDAVFVMLWLTAELLGVMMQRRMYAYHFIVLGPPAALAVGLLARTFSTRSIVMAFGPVVAATTSLVVSALLDRPAVTRDDRIIAYIDHHTRPDDAVWCDDYPRLLVETDRQPGSAVPLIFLMANGDNAPDFFGHRLLEDWSSRRPAYIAFAAEPQRVAALYRHHMADVASSPARADAIARQIDLLQHHLRAHYRAETDIGNVRIWRRDPAVSVAAGG